MIRLVGGLVRRGWRDCWGDPPGGSGAIPRSSTPGRRRSLHLV